MSGGFFLRCLRSFSESVFGRSALFTFLPHRSTTMLGPLLGLMNVGIEASFLLFHKLLLNNCAKVNAQDLKVPPLT